MTPSTAPTDEQRSVIWFLMLESVSGSEIWVRMCMVWWCAECCHKINCEPAGADVQGKTNEYKW